MIASVFSAGTSGGAIVEEYLVNKADREIAPELFKGDMAVTRDLIDTNRRRWKYTSGVLAFHNNDEPSQIQLFEIVRDFEDFMFAGKEPDTFNITWVLHRDKGNVELHFVVPRVDLETGQDLNIAPPGYHKDWKPWVASVNHRYGFKDPYAQNRKVTKSLYQETPDRKASREEIHQWIENKNAAGEISNREGLIALLEQVGEITRINEKFISLKTEAADKVFRLRGAIFEADFDFSVHSVKRQLTSPHASDCGVSGGQEIFDGTQKLSSLPPAPRLKDEEAPRRIAQDRHEAFLRRRDFFKKHRAKSKKLKEMIAYNEELAKRGAEAHYCISQPADAFSDLETWADALSDVPDRPDYPHMPSPAASDTLNIPEQYKQPLPLRSESASSLITGTFSGIDSPFAIQIPNPKIVLQGEANDDDFQLSQKDLGKIDGDNGSIAAAHSRLRAREQRLAQINGSRAAMLAAHQDRLSSLVQLAENAGRAIERIGGALRKLIERLKIKMRAPSPAIPKPKRSGPSGP